MFLSTKSPFKFVFYCCGFTRVRIKAFCYTNNFVYLGCSEINIFMFSFSHRSRLLGIQGKSSVFCVAIYLFISELLGTLVLLQNTNKYETTELL